MVRVETQLRISEQEPSVSGFKSRVKEIFTELDDYDRNFCPRFDVVLGYGLRNCFTKRYRGFLVYPEQIITGFDLNEGLFLTWYGLEKIELASFYEDGSWKHYPDYNKRREASIDDYELFSLTALKKLEESLQKARTAGKNNPKCFARVVFE